MSKLQLPIKMSHRLIGECELIRIEGTTWIVRALDSTAEYRFPVTRRGEFTLRAVSTASVTTDVPEVPAPTSTSCEVPSDDLESFEGMIADEDICLAVPVAHFEINSDPCGENDGDMKPPATGASPKLELERLPAKTWIDVKKCLCDRGELSGIEERLCLQLAATRRSRVAFDSGLKEAASFLFEKALKYGYAFPPTRGEMANATSTAPCTIRPATRLPPSESTVLNQDFGHAVKPPTSSISEVNLDQTDPRLLRRILHSLKCGLSPDLHHLERLAVGNESILEDLRRLLRQTDAEGGSALIVRGGYGQGKTFTLRILEDLAADAGFMTARTEIDANEIRLDKPHHVYGSLINTLRIPGTEVQGAKGLAEAASRFIRTSTPASEIARTREWLRRELECRPLAWLLSDPRLIEKPLLLRLLSAESGPTAQFRAAHAIKSQPRDWPAFSAGTQGDVASYLISGIGRLARLMGYKGLILLMDEMEKWQDLHWVAQSRAGNLLGGLIWSATARAGRRCCLNNVEEELGSKWGHSSFTCDHDSSLEHSGRCGGYPFTTSRPCYLGLAIALTPRGSAGPESIWERYGTTKIVDLPTFDVGDLRSYFDRIEPVYRRAYGIDVNNPNAIFENAVSRWRETGDRGSRSAVTAIVAALEQCHNPPTATKVESTRPNKPNLYSPQENRVEGKSDEQVELVGCSRPCEITFTTETGETTTLTGLRRIYGAVLKALVNGGDCNTKKELQLLIQKHIDKSFRVAGADASDKTNEACKFLASQGLIAYKDPTQRNRRTVLPPGRTAKVRFL